MLWGRRKSRPRVEYEYVLEVEPLVSAEENVFEYLAAPYEKFAEVLAENIRLKWALTAGKLLAYKRAHEIARRRITWLARNILAPPRQPPGSPLRPGARDGEAERKEEEA
ncbi:hypothetical protein Pyrde_1905 [Pyrodictium delaneyi]|uniref:Uncharacterized protein n=1 Tax=Pyrodictium delaneyi TaxID=1273541 RepID=A0A0P0N589_9CREN|nr:hypothetical protein [Pyrodictium delaneyi]ALL01948.1 hypothetical protein Pyrde_1905 [Pyrodictium delaneyi]